MFRWLRRLISFKRVGSLENEIELLELQYRILRSALEDSDPAFVNRLKEIDQLESREEKAKALAELRQFPLSSDD